MILIYIYHLYFFYISQTFGEMLGNLGKCWASLGLIEAKKGLTFPKFGEMWGNVGELFGERFPVAKVIWCHCSRLHYAERRRLEANAARTHYG